MLISCSWKVKNYDYGFTLKLPQGLDLAGFTKTERMTNDYLPNAEIEKAYLYTNNSHGNVLVAAGKVQEDYSPAFGAENAVINKVTWSVEDKC